MAGGSGRGHAHPVPPTPSSRRHCWVRGGPAAPGPHPGIILEWQKRDSRWLALVSYVVEADGAVVQQWLAAELLTPAGR